MALNKRERVLLVTTITLLVCGVSYLLVLPLTKTRTSLLREVATQRGELQMIKATIDRAPVWQAQYDALRGSLGKTKRYTATSDVLKKIEELGTAAGIIISNRRPMPVVEKDVYRELPVACTIEATTESLVKFLYALQTGAGSMSIEQLQIAPRPDNSCILRCDIQIRALSGKMEGSGT
ncbi:MAG: type II secretion system protein GspM [Verrucomicrobiia bacterium]